MVLAQHHSRTSQHRLTLCRASRPQWSLLFSQLLKFSASVNEIVEFVDICIFELDIYCQGDLTTYSK